MSNSQDKILAAVLIIVLLISVVFFSMIKGTEVEEEVSDALLATRGYTAGIAQNINAEDLYELLNDTDAENDPFILSIRSVDHYALGHIPGAVNIPLSSLFTADNLARLPMDKQIVVYCYTGHTASQATALLNVNGYDAVCLTWGMCSWTTDEIVTVGKCYDMDTAAHDYPFITGTDAGSFDLVVGTMIHPRLISLTPLGCGGDTEPADDVVIAPPTDADSLQELTHASLNMGKPAVVKADALYENLNDGNDANDPFLLSVRKAEHYELGHIPGAVNIGMTELFSQEKLTMLPDDDQQIVVICYTGHTASQATALLNLNGYNATALMWGMCSWTTDEEVTAGKCFNASSHAHDYDFATGIWDTELSQTMYDSVNQGKPIAVTAESVYDRLTDDDMTNDPFILSLRKADDYAVGHIPGAVNIGLTSLFTDESLAQLPYDRQIITVCYTGHTASQAASLLNALGFNATALKWGMCSWNAETTIDKCYDATSHLGDYPFVTGSEPGSMP